MICIGDLCEFNGLCIDTDNINCYREQYKPTPIDDIDTFTSEPFNAYGWRFKYHKGLFYNTGTGERYLLKRKGKSFEITYDFLKHINDGYRRTSINDKVLDSRIEHTLNNYITDLIKEDII